MKHLPAKMFITGTDTNIGKTLVAAILTLGLKARYWKPIQSGTIDGTDTDWMREKTKLGQEHFVPETFKLSQPLSPHASAEIDGVTISLSDFRVPPEAVSPYLIVEGAGGVAVPINQDTLMSDLIRYLGLPALVVARSGLGTINHTVLTITELRRKNIPIIGVVMNGDLNDSNRRAIERYASVPVIAEIETLNSIDPITLQNIFDRCFAGLTAPQTVKSASNSLRS